MFDPILIVAALAAGLLFKQIGFPPMLGYLLAGFAAHPLGLVSGPLISHLADIGITLLLFTIGLKLNIRDLGARHVWGVAGLHMLGSLVFFSALLLGISRGLEGLAADGSSLAAQLSPTAIWTIAFALSFSSTVLAVKVFEDRGESAALFAKISVAILIVQDLEAVVYLAVSKGKMPELSALLLLLLIPCRPLLHRLLALCGHGELVTLFGFGVAFGAASLFEFFHLKGDFGALLVGVLLSGGAKSTELSKTLMGFKDLFLVGFFLSIGMSGLPGHDGLWVAVILGLAAVFKPLLYFPLFVLMKVRARTALLSSLALFNHSEFGLIVAGVAVSHGLLGQEWLAIIAVALAVSFFLAVPINARAATIYNRHKLFFKRWQRTQRLPEEETVSLGEASVLVLGLGRVGSGAYHYLQGLYPNRIAGVEEDSRKVETKREKGFNVVRGDASDRDFWDRLNLDQIELVMICLTNHAENVAVVQMLNALGYHGNIAVVARFPDQLTQLEELGCISYNFYAEAGHGFAEHVDETLALRRRTAEDAATV